MPWNGLGTYTPPPASFPEYTGNLVDAPRYDNVINDAAAGISLAIARTGENLPVANLPMGGFKHTGAAPATADGQYLTYEQLAGAFSTIPPVVGVWQTGCCRVVDAGVTLETADMAGGYTFSVFNNSASPVVVTAGAGVTLRLAGSATTGNRTLTAFSLATIWCASASVGVMIGAGVS